MSQSIQQARVGVAKAAVLTVLAAVGVIAAGYGVSRGVGKPQLAMDIATAGGVLLLAGLPGLVLSVVLTGKLRGGASIGFVAGIAVRLPAGGVVAFYGLNWGLAQTPAFSQVVAFAYLVILVIEVVLLSPAVKRTAAAEVDKAPADKTSGDQESV